MFRGVGISRGSALNPNSGIDLETGFRIIGDHKLGGEWALPGATLGGRSLVDAGRGMKECVGIKDEGKGREGGEGFVE